MYYLYVDNVPISFFSQMKCPLSAECIHRDLFCDGMINCPSDALGHIS